MVSPPKLHASQQKRFVHDIIQFKSHIQKTIMKKTIAAVVISAVAALGSANAAIVFGNLGNSGSDALSESGNGVTTTTWWATGFSVASPNVYLNSATIGLIGSGTIELSLYSSSAGNPGTLLASDTATVASLVATSSTFSFQNPLSFTLNAGDTYWLVGRALSGSATWAFADSETTPTGLNGSGWIPAGGLRSVNSGGAWTSPGFAPFSSVSIDATATPIPEPGTWAAMAILAGGAAFAGWRRRQQQLA